MTLGKDEQGNGIITLTPDEFARFQKGSILSKRGQDAKGQFTITVSLQYDHLLHDQEARYAHLLSHEGEAMYRGWVIRSGHNLGYDVDAPGREPHWCETVNEALHHIDASS